MSRTISNKHIFRSSSILISISIVMILGVFVYASNYMLFKNFRPYYVKAYASAMSYSLHNLGKDTVNAQPSTTPSSVPVLLYHGIMKEQEDENIALDQFVSQMQALKSNGYSAISYQEYYDFVANNKPLPNKPILITFDDGRKDSYYPVDPILKSLGYKATIFVITGQNNDMESPFYLNKTEIEKMIDSGRWDIQVHTKDGHGFESLNEDSSKKGHFYSNKLWISDLNRLESDAEYKLRISQDLSSAKNDLSLDFGISATGFAFPFGDSGQEETNYSNAHDVLMQEVSDNYAIAFEQWWPSRGFSQSYYKDAETFNLTRRINVAPHYSASELLTLLENGESKRLPYKSNFESNEGWQKTWGTYEIADNNLTLKADTDTKGAAVFLDGTGSWKDYTFSSATRLARGSYVGLVARYVDDSNNISCNFTPSDVAIVQLKNGTQSTLNRSTITNNIGFDYRNVSIKVIGNRASCMLNGDEIVSSNFDAMLKQGGVGYKTWSEEINNAEIVIDTMEVTQQ